MRNKIDSTTLNDIDGSNEWLIGRMDEDSDDDEVQELLELKRVAIILEHGYTQGVFLKCLGSPTLTYK